MAQLRQDHQEFINRQVKILVIGPDSAKRFSDYWQKHDLPFTGLPDPHGSVLKLYGQEINLFKLGRIPAQVILDKKGIARFVHYGNSMADIPTNNDLFEIFNDLNGSSL